MMDKDNIVTHINLRFEWPPPTEEIPSTVVERYRELSELMASAMLRELCANHYKGGWNNYDYQKSWNEVEHHVNKMQQVYNALVADKKAGEYSSHWLKNRLIEMAADVANCSMFLADNFGFFTSDQIRKRAKEPDLVPYDEDAADGLKKINKAIEEGTS